KVLVRERARALGIPVLMETSDRGLLDVERFDLEPKRPLFHGLVGDVRASDLRGLTTKEKVPFALAILDHEQLSMRLAASFAEIDHSISSWPQLASAVALGGAVVADATRRVLLGRPLASGRYYLDMEERTAASAGSHHEPRACALPEDPGPLRAPQAPPQAPRTPGAELGVEHLRELAGYAVLAPSGHNMQAWRFVGHGRGLRCEVDRERVMTELEFGRIGSDIGLGAAVENIVLAAGAAGWVAEPQGFEPHTGVCDIHVHVGHHRVAAPDPLFEQLLERCTNRQLGQGERLGPEDRAVLAGEAEASGARLEFVDAWDGLEELAELVGTADVVALQMQGVHADLMHGMRWSSEQAARARDGLDVHALELSATDRAAMRIMTRWPVLEFLREHGFGDALKEGSQRSVCSAGAMAVLSVPHAGADAYFRGGRAVQRVWLRATERRLAVQPMMTLPAFLARLGTSGEQAFTAAQRSQMRAVAERFFALFPARSGNTQVMLLRLAYAPPPTARSIRRPLSEVFSLEARG
ncbi:MAG: hypothetical protein OXR73_04380, partial [Myxococcales bacterium]|nr:hypothetical protein [Myxococcales bacterium]